MTGFLKFGIATAMLLVTATASAQYIPLSLLTDDDILPSGGTVENVGQPSINAAGQVCFEGDDDSATALDEFIWVDGVEVIRSGNDMLDTLAVVLGPLDIIDSFENQRTINLSGQVAFDGDMDIADTTMDEILARDTTVLMREDTIYPGVDAVRDPGEWTQVSIDDAGTVYAEVDMDGGATTDDEILVMIPVGGTPSRVAMNLFSDFAEGTTIVGGALDSEVWDSVPFSGTVVNAGGSLITDGNLDEVGGTTTTTDDVIVRKLPGVDYELLARAGDLIATPAGTTDAVSSFTDPQIADNDDWIVEIDTDGDTGSDNLIYGDVNGSGPTVFVQEGQDISALTGFAGTTISFIDAVSLNSAGQITFFAAIDDDGVNVPPYSEGLFRWEAGVVSLLMTNDAPIANLAGTPPLTDFESNDLATNNSGEIVFQGDANSTARDGIFEAFLPTTFPVELLMCTVDPLAPDVVSATWTNPQVYDGIRVFVNGVLDTTLAGTAVSYDAAPVTSPTNITIELEPFVGADNAPTASCSGTGVTPPTSIFCNTPATFFDDSTPIADVLNVPVDLSILDVTLLLDITHTFQGDLDIDVTSPGGTTITLTTDNGGSNDDVLTTFADFGQPISGNLNDFNFTAPEGPGSFADFSCESSLGDWTLDVVDDSGGDSGTLNEWCLNLYESVGDPDCCPKPTAFTCTNIGACGGPGAQLTWNTPGAYSLQQLIRDDGVNPPTTIALGAADTSFLDATALAGTSYTYTLQYTCVGGAAIQDAASCVVAIDTTTVTPITDVVAVPDFCNNTVDLSWNTNGVTYDSVELFRAGTLVASVTGQSTFTDTAPASGTYSLVATCSGSSEATNTTVTFEFGGVTNFACASDVGGVLLSWTNNDSYTVFEIARNGTPLATQPTIGDTSFLDTTAGDGCNTYTLTAGCSTFTETYTCVLAFFDPLAPITETVLMIPDRTNDTIALHSKECGAFIRNLFDPATLPAGVTLGTTISAVYNPADDRIYLSDQTNDRVVRFERDGTFVDIFADDGVAGAVLDNLRGIDFRGPDLFVVQDGAAPAEGLEVFDALGTPLGTLVAGVGFWDVVVLADDRFLITESTTDTITLYEADGLTGTDLLIPGLSFVEQIAELPNGNFLAVEFTNDELIEFDLTGTVLNTFDVSAAGTTPRGAALLDNGTYLFTGNDAYILDPVSGTVSSLNVNSTSLSFIEELPPEIVIIEDQFVRGDANDDGTINIADAVFLLGNLFPVQGVQNILNCDDSADANDDGTLNIADAIALLGSLFGNPAIPLPSPNATDGCGVDPTDNDGLECGVFNGCP